MSFIAKKDWFNLGGAGLSVSDSSDGKSAQNVTALTEKGEVGANTVFAELLAPSNTYKLAGTVTSSFTLGNTNVVDGHRIMLGSVSINTAAGGEPTIQASGEEVELSANAHTCTFSSDSAVVTPKRHAQLLFNAFSYNKNQGVFLTDAKYDIQANIGKATVNGEPIASDVTEGAIVANVTFTQTLSVEPQVSADLSADWQITSPLACTNPDANYPTWTCTLTKYLKKDS